MQESLFSNYYDNLKIAELADLDGGADERVGGEGAREPKVAQLGAPVGVDQDVVLPKQNSLHENDENVGDSTVTVK